jgi:hypothetical protein
MRRIPRVSKLSGKRTEGRDENTLVFSVVIPAQAGMASL